MSINKSKNAKGERRKVEEKLENLETQKWRNKGESAYALRDSGVTRRRRGQGRRVTRAESRGRICHKKAQKGEGGRLKIWKLRINFQGRSYGSHISAGSQVSEPSLCLQTTTAPSQPMANPTIGEADSKSSSGISERGKANSIPAISA